MFTPRTIDTVGYNVGLLDKKFESDQFLSKKDNKLSYDAKMAIFKSNNLWLANTFPESVHGFIDYKHFYRPAI